MKKLWFTIRIIFSLSILGILIYKVGLSQIINTFLTMNKIYLIPVLLLYSLALFVGALNIYLLVKKIKKSIKLRNVINYYLLSWASGSLMPGRLGEFSILYLLKKEKINYGESLAITIIDKLITLMILFLSAILVVILLLDLTNTYRILILLMSIIILFFVVKSEIVRNTIKRFISKKFADKFKNFNKTLSKFIKHYKKILLLNFFLTVLKSIITSVITYLIFLSFDSRASVILVLLISTALTIIALVPITVNGIGLREGVAIFLYGLIGLKPEVVISTYIFSTIIMYLYSMFIFMKIRIN